MSAFKQRVEEIKQPFIYQSGKVENKNKNHIDENQRLPLRGLTNAMNIPLQKLEYKQKNYGLKSCFFWIGMCF